MNKIKLVIALATIFFLAGCSTPINHTINTSKNDSNPIMEINETNESLSASLEKKDIEEDENLSSDYDEVPNLPNEITKPKIVGATQIQKDRIEKILDKFNDETLNKLSFVEVKSYLDCEESGEKDHETCTTSEYIVEPASMYYNVMRMTIVIYDPDRQSNSELRSTLEKGLRHHYEYQKYGTRIFEKEEFIESTLPPSFYKSS